MASRGSARARGVRRAGMRGSRARWQASSLVRSKKQQKAALFADQIFVSRVGGQRPRGRPKAHHGDHANRRRKLRRRPRDDFSRRAQRPAHVAHAESSRDPKVRRAARLTLPSRAPLSRERHVRVEGYPRTDRLRWRSTRHAFDAPRGPDRWSCRDFANGDERGARARGV
jgi:hypothetical protein